MSLRRTLDNLIFSDLEKTFKENITLQAQVLEPTRGGYFVEAEGGIKGFLPNSQVLTEESLTGKTISVKIIELDRAKKRVIFSQKATAYITDPTKLQSLFPKDKKVTGTVTQPTSYGVYVSLPGEDGKLVEGFIHISEVSYDRVENLTSMYKKGDVLEVAVLDIDRENRRVNVSLKSLAEDTFSSISEKYKKEDKVKGTVTDVRSRGVTLELEKGVSAFIASDKVPAGTTYKVGESINVEVSDFDKKRRVVIVSPIVTKVSVGYR